MEEKQTLKEFLINNYSNKQLATLYLHNNKKQIDSIYFQVIENILKENNIDITRQLPEDYIVDNYEFINNTNVNMHIIDKSMEIGDINASKIIVTRSLLSLRRMFFNVFSIELYASFIIFFLIILSGSFQITYLLVDFIILLCTYFFIFLPKCLYPTMSIQENLLLIFNQKLHKDKLFLKIADKIKIDVEMQLHNARYSYLYAFLVYAFKFDYAYDFGNFEVAIDSLKRNQPYLPDTELYHWILSWLHYFNNDYNNAAKQLQYIAHLENINILVSYFEEMHKIENLTTASSGQS